MSGLTERLRERGEWEDGGKAWASDTLCYEAASALDAKDAEIERLAKANDELAIGKDDEAMRDILSDQVEHTVEQLLARIAKLEAALRPFIAFLEAYPRPRIKVSAEDTIFVSIADTQLTLADLDRAGAALNPTKSETEADGMWFPLKGDSRLGRCATKSCGGQPTWRFEGGGIGSDYCPGCKEKLEVMAPSSEAPAATAGADERTKIALWAAWRELNEIRARDGVPYTHQGYQASVDEEYFSRVVDELADILGKDALPWPAKRWRDQDGSFQFGVQAPTPPQQD